MNEKLLKFISTYNVSSQKYFIVEKNNNISFESSNRILTSLGVYGEKFSNTILSLQNQCNINDGQAGKGYILSPQPPDTQCRKSKSTSVKYLPLANVSEHAV